MLAQNLSLSTFPLLLQIFFMTNPAVDSQVNQHVCSNYNVTLQSSFPPKNLGIPTALLVQVLQQSYTRRCHRKTWPLLQFRIGFPLQHNVIRKKTKLQRGKKENYHRLNEERNASAQRSAARNYRAVIQGCWQETRPT